MAGDVFISHASEDAGVTAQVCALLEGRGLRCWMAPRDVPGGAVWDEAILDAIEGSRVFLLILSGKANQSQFVKNEVNRAFSQNKPIVTFRLEEVAPGRSLELYLARHHWTDAFPPPLGARVETLADSVAVLLNGAAGPAATVSPVATAAAQGLLPRPSPGARLQSSLRMLATEVRTLGWQRQLIVVAVLLLVAAIASLVTWNLRPSATAPKLVTRTVITLPAGDHLAPSTFNPILALSPDGTRLVYTAVHGELQQLYLRALDSLEARAIPGTEGAANPFFSPDGDWIGFVAGGKVKKVALSGGTALTLGDAPNMRGASWGSRGTIIFAPTEGSVIQEVSDAGGAAHVMTHFDKGETSHRWPEFFSDAKSVLFVGGTAGNGSIAPRQIIVQSPTGQRKKLIDGATSPHYVAAGYLLYVQSGALMAVPFDTKLLEIVGKAVAVVGNIAWSPVSDATQYSISDNGSLAYVSGAVQVGADRLVWVSRNGTEQLLVAPARRYSYPRLSPDGRRLAVTVTEQDSQIWLYDLDRDTLTRLTFGGSSNQIPAWTPDSKRIAFRSNREGPPNIFWQLADGSGGLERLTSSEYPDDPISFSPDGQLLAHFTVVSNTGADSWVLRLSDHKDQPFLKTQANESVPAFSPDGHWLAYASDESGRYEIYVQPYPGPGGKWQISTDGGNEPVWNPKGGELFYRSGDKMMAVTVTTRSGFSVGRPKMLFEGAYLPPAASVPFYDVSRDGQRFLMIKPNEETSSLTQIVVVQNWFEELKQKVPTGKK